MKTQLENPTRYFIAQKQKRQLKEYLKTQGSPTASDLAAVVSSASQPTLNAINQQAVAALASGHLMRQPESPMAVMSPEGNNASEVSGSFCLIPLFILFFFLIRVHFPGRHLVNLIVIFLAYELIKSTGRNTSF